MESSPEDELACLLDFDGARYLFDGSARRQRGSGRMGSRTA
jgi:hypothetical protein